MRASVAFFTKKFISAFFAATLALGLVPAAAFADDAAAPDEAAAITAEGTAAEGASSELQDGSDASGQDAAASDGLDQSMGGSQDGPGTDVAEPAMREDPAEDDAAAGDDPQTAIPAATERISETVSLTQLVAQQESTRSFFLAQTLESTKTVPIVSANLPLDKGTTDEVANSDAPAEGEGGSEDEGGDGSDESDLGSDASDDASVVAPGVSSESTVVGSFAYLGMTFAVQPGGESVALVAVDYSKLPEEFVQKQILVVPDAATPDGIDHYSVTRIAANAFSSLTEDNADPDHTGCIELFSDEELLAEAGIDPAEVAGFLPQDDAAAVTEDGQDANPSSDARAKAEAFAYEDQVTDDVNSDAIRTIVSMDGNVATLDDGSTYGFANPLEGCAGILALGIPVSVSNIEDDAFAGADTLQYVVVSEDNSEYASFDGALYSADMTNLRLIPEGRVGAVRVAPSATSADPEVFSHCPSVDALVADAESEVSFGFLDSADGIETRHRLLRLLAHHGSSNIGSATASLLPSMLPMLLDVTLESRAFTVDSRLSSLAIVENPDGKTYTVTAPNLVMYFGNSSNELDRLETVGNHLHADIWSADREGARLGTNFKYISNNVIRSDEAITIKLHARDAKNKSGYLRVAVQMVGVTGEVISCLKSRDAEGIYGDESQYWDGGITRIDVQQKWAFQNKSIRSFSGSSDLIELNTAPAGEFTQVWVNGAYMYKYLSAEYKPNGATWSSVDNYATRADDSKLILTSSGGGYAYMGAGSMSIRVGNAPENAPQGLPFFTGWRCANDGKTYQPGDIIPNVREPLIFEAQWSGDFTLRWNAGVSDGTVIGLPDDTIVSGASTQYGLKSSQALGALFPTIASLPSAPVRGKWVFSGWYSDQDCTRPLDSAQLSKHVVVPTYAGSDKASQITSDRNGIVNIYAGWSVRYDNLTVYANGSVFSSGYRSHAKMDATNGISYRVAGNQSPLDVDNNSVTGIKFNRQGNGSYAYNTLTVCFPLISTSRPIGDSICHITSGLDYADTAASGGIVRAFVQDSTASLNKTVRLIGSGSSLSTVDLEPSSKAKLWLNDYKYQMWLSEEYLPNGGTWATVDANATSSDDSKYYEHAGKTYDGTTSTTVTVKAAPDNVPADKPVFTGWKCLDDGKVYLPGDVIANVKRPLRFEAQWSESFSLKWDGNADGDPTSTMPAVASLAAMPAGSYAICFSGIAGAYPTVADLPSSLAREGWKFSGWCLDSNCTMRVTADMLRKPVVSASFSGPLPADCIQAASDGSITLYAGWALAYDNLTVFSQEPVYVSSNRKSVTLNAVSGSPYLMPGKNMPLDTVNNSVKEIEFWRRDTGSYSYDSLVVRIPTTNASIPIGDSVCHIAENLDYSDPTASGGIMCAFVQDSTAKLNKTVRLLGRDSFSTRMTLEATSKAKLWLNDYRYSMWLSEEYLPGEGASWATVDANATSADDSKYYEHEGRTYDGITSTTVTVREAPDNAPEDRPVFLGWRCRLMDGTYMEGLLQPGDEIEEVSEPLVFEAVWTDIYNVAVPLLVGVALDPATGEARASEGASLSTTNPSQVKVVSLEYDLVEETDDLDGKGEASVPGGGTHRVFSDEEGASHLDEVSLTVLAGEAGAVPLEVPLSAPCRLDDVDALAAAGFVPFGAAAGDLAIEYGLRFSLEGDALTDMLGRLGLPEKDGLDGASSESFPIAKLFYTIAMVERGD